MQNYRALSPQEVEELEKQGCKCSDWNKILVKPGFSTKYVQGVQFSGTNRIGLFNKGFDLPGGIKCTSGLYNSSIYNCTIEDNVLIDNIRNYIANYTIGEGSFIENTNAIYTDGYSTFGNSVEVAVLNETGGREVSITDHLSAPFAYLEALYRHRPELIKKLKGMTSAYAESIKSNRGTIGKNVKILNAGSIINVKIGENAHIEGTGSLKNGSINSNAEAPVFIGTNVIAQDFIVSSGVQITDAAYLTHCFVGQACHIGNKYSAHDSLIFSNCALENGEACAIFAGPYTVSMHKSSLLIAGMFSFCNAGSGSNQSNHMYKLGPIHQGIVERGSKTTSDSYILWPAKVGAFSLVMGRHVHNSDTSDMPFSYLIEQGDETYLVPGVNLRSVGTVRDAQKWPKRDKRTDPQKLDPINFNLLSPYTISKMYKAINNLHALQKISGETSDVYTYQSAKIKRSSLVKGLEFYQTAIHKFLGNSIIKRLENIKFQSNEEIRARLQPDSPIGLGEWVDLSGLIAPKSEIDRFIELVESDQITTIDEANNYFNELHANYYTYEWAWAWENICHTYHTNINTITAQDIIVIVKTWKEAVIGLDKLLYSDAHKEFTVTSQTGFGADGSQEEKMEDFEQVRGDFENNAFVTSLLKHIEVKSALGDEIIERIKHIQ